MRTTSAGLAREVVVTRTTNFSRVGADVEVVSLAFGRYLIKPTTECTKTGILILFVVVYRVATTLTIFLSYETLLSIK